MKQKVIERLISDWEKQAEDYRNQEDYGHETLRVELNAIARTLKRCAEELKNAQK